MIERVQCLTLEEKILFCIFFSLLRVCGWQTCGLCFTCGSLMMYEGKGVPFRICLYNLLPPQKTLLFLLFLSSLCFCWYCWMQLKWKLADDSIMIIIKMLIISGRLVCCFYWPNGKWFASWPFWWLFWPRSISASPTFGCVVFITVLCTTGPNRLSLSLVESHPLLSYCVALCLCLFMFMFFLVFSFFLEAWPG